MTINLGWKAAHDHAKTKLAWIRQERDRVWNELISERYRNWKRWKWIPFWRKWKGWHEEQQRIRLKAAKGWMQWTPDLLYAHTENTCNDVIKLAEQEIPVTLTADELRSITP